MQIFTGSVQLYISVLCDVTYSEDRGTPVVLVDSCYTQTLSDTQTYDDFPSAITK
jgi:hypothetical protein